MVTNEEDEKYNGSKTVMNNNKNKIWSIDNTENGEEDISCYNYEDALNLAGNGKYNLTLLLVLSLVLFSMGLDMFGFSVVVVGLSCDFTLTLAQRGILTSIPFAGVLIMSYPWGYLSDTIGRKTTLTLAMTVSFIAAVLSSFSPNWIVLAVLKLITSSFSCAAQSATYVLLGECCVSRVRDVYMLLMTTAILIVNSVYYWIGYVILKLDFSYDLGILDIHFTPWRLLSLMFAFTLGLSALGLIFLYESPKFLTNQGNIKEAIDVLTKIYVRNNGAANNFPVKDLILDEKVKIRNSDTGLLKSVWRQTAPLFRPPLLLRTLQLYFLTIVIYSTNNSFSAWFPFITNAFFASYYTETSPEGNGLCSLIVESLSNSTASSNDNNFDTICTKTLALETAIAATIHSVICSTLNIIISRFSNRKKLVMLLVLTTSAVGGVGSNLAPEPLSSMMMFIILMITAVCMGLVPTYFVDLFPTSYRGMVACLGVMVARMSALAGINLVGAIIVDHCTTTFYYWSAFILSGVLVAFFLPKDNPKKI